MSTAVKTKNPKELPELLYRATFEGLKVIFRGELLKRFIIKNKKWAADRAFRVGDYAYVEQSMVGDSKYAALARADRKIMWIIKISSGEVVARVEDGKVIKL